MKIEMEAKRIDAFAAGVRALRAKIEAEHVLILSQSEKFAASNQPQSEKEALEICEHLAEAKKHLISAAVELGNAVNGCKDFADGFETFGRALVTV